MSGFLATLRRASSERPGLARLIVGLAFAAGCIAGFGVMGPALFG